MADLVEITFPSEEKAEQVRQKLLDMQKEYLIELADAAIAVKQPNGHVKLNQLFNPTASGAVSGTFWGALIGMIFLMPLAGAAIGVNSQARDNRIPQRSRDRKRQQRDASDPCNQRLERKPRAPRFLPRHVLPAFGGHLSPIFAELQFNIPFRDQSAHHDQQAARNDREIEIRRLWLGVANNASERPPWSPSRPALLLAVCAIAEWTQR